MPPRPRPRGLPVILALLLLGVVGCVSGSAAPPEPKRTSTGPTNASSAVLGGPRTIDPCAMTDPAALRRFGHVTRAGTVSLDYCLLHVRTGDGSLLQLAVGELHHVDPAVVTRDAPVTRRGPFRLVREAPLPGHCTRLILFSDGIAMEVSADLLRGDPGSGLCSVAEAGAQEAVTAIDRGRLRHRRFAPNSLALTDPCRLVAPDVVRRVPGLGGARPHSTPARHQCRWGEQSARASRVRLVHTAGDPPRKLNATAVTERIAGRRTVVSIVGGDPRTPLCMAETAHIPFGAANSGQVEVAMLVVALPGGDGIDACEYTRGLAERIWPRLPAR